MKKSILVIVTVFVMSMVLIACGGSGSSNNNQNNANSNTNTNAGNNNKTEVIKLKLATSVPPEGAFSKLGIEPFIAKVDELTNGRIQVEHYPSETLGKAQDLFQLASDGVADISYINVGVNVDKIPLANLASLPGLFGSGYQGSMALYEVTQQSPFIDEYLKHGVRPIFGGTTRPFDVWTTGLEVRTPEDVKGVQIGGGGGAINEIIELVGAVPVTTTPPEIFESLERGVIKGYTMHAAIMKDYGALEVAKFGTQNLQMGGFAFNFVMNENKWQSLSAEEQEALLIAGKGLAESAKYWQDEASETAINEYKDKIKLHYITEEEKAKWQVEFDKFNDIQIQKYKDRGLDAETAVNMIKEAVSKYPVQG